MRESAPSLDPYAVLELDSSADAQRIREAFLRKSKKHHPDQGGDEWAFRIVVWAYELLNNALSEATVERSSTRERSRRRSRSSHSRSSGRSDHRVSRGDVGSNSDFNSSAMPRRVEVQSERVREGILDRGFPPEQMILTEIQWYRQAVSDVYAMIKGREGKTFGGTIHLVWPDPNVSHLEPVDPVILHQVISHLSDVYDYLCGIPEATGADCKTDQGIFEAWVSFARGRHAWDAFGAIRPELNQRGLGVHQRTREVIVKPADDIMSP